LGPGAAKVAVDARDLSRIFGLGPGNPNVLIQGLELRNCYATNGAAISASGNLTLVKTVISGNTTTGDGGAVAAYAALTIRQSIISGNSAGDDGGGVYFAGTTLTVVKSTISGNTASGDPTSCGGGLYLKGGTATIRSSVI